jgi:hypothetical protein
LDEPRSSGPGPDRRSLRQGGAEAYVLDGSITAFVGDQRIDVAAGSYAALPKDVPHGLTVRGDEVRLLITLEPAGAEYFFVPRDDADADPARFGIALHEHAPAV